MTEQQPDNGLETTADVIADYDDPVEADSAAAPRQGIDWQKAVAFAVLPAAAALLAMLAGYLRWQVTTESDSRNAAIGSVAAARDSAMAMLAYAPDTAEKDLMAARDRLTGTFLDSYTELVKNIVIPGSREKKISSVVQVPAAGSVTAKSDHAVVLLFIDQATTVGKEKPTDTTSSVRVTLDRVGERWLVSNFEPI